MRKIILLLLISALLAGCNVIPANKPTLTSGEMATRVAQLLTAMPTSTLGAVIPEIDPLLPTPTEPLNPDEIYGDGIGAIATPTEADGFATPTMDMTELAIYLGIADTVTPTPLIAMPSPTPTATLEPTATPLTTVEGQPPAPNATATFTPADPRSLLPVSATWTDSMDNGKNWPTGADSFSAIGFNNGYMELTGLSKDNGWRLAINDVDNAYFEITASFGTVCKGTDRWGMMLRVPDRSTADKGYWFNITCDGKYAFQRWNASPPDGQSKVTNLVAWTSHNGILSGANAINRLGVLAKGGQYTLYINGLQVNQVTDNSFLSGGYGVLVGAKETDNFKIFVDEFSYWMNPNF